MAQLIQITDAADPRLCDYVALRDVALRRHLEAEQGLFIAEGEKVVRRAAEAGYLPRSFLLTGRWLAGLADVLARVGDVPCYVVSAETAERITGFHVHRGALASMRRRPLPTVDEVLASARRIVVLEDIADHTNVGAVFRCSAALGMDAVLVSPRCADPLYRRSIKVAMGAVFSIPWTRMDEWYDAMLGLADVGFTTIALTPSADAADVVRVAADHRGDKVALILGSEGPGMSTRWLDSADVRAGIVMSNGVDSLNVAAAAAIAFHAFTRGS
ncbi:MAG: TrmH family RNA methyltransferase [Nocardioidaceae bacterium]